MFHSIVHYVAFFMLFPSDYRLIALKNSKKNLAYFTLIIVNLKIIKIKSKKFHLRGSAMG